MQFFSQQRDGNRVKRARLGNKPGPAVVTAEQNEIANRGLKTVLPCLQPRLRRWQLDRQQKLNERGQAVSSHTSPASAPRRWPSSAAGNEPSRKTWTKVRGASCGLLATLDDFYPRQPLSP